MATDPAASTLHTPRSAERALALLDTVVTAGAATLTEAAVATDVPPSTALRHLRTLAGHGYLTRDELGQYSVGPTFLRLSLAAFRSGPYARLTAAAQPMLDRLARITEESAYLAVRDGTHAVYIATAESPRAIRHVGWVGSSVPVEGTAVGEALLAPSGRPDDRPPTFFNVGSIEPDVSAVTAPIFGSATVLGALSLLGPSERLAGRRRADAERAIVDAAVETALALSDPEPNGVR